MKKWIIFYLLSVSRTFANQPDKESAKPLFVSLGGYCEVATQLKHHGLRSEAFPFDWMFTLNHEKFLALLDNDFQFFLDENYLFSDPADPSILENGYYECEFRHDLPANPPGGLSCHIQELRQKYERRIARFRNLKEYQGHVFFIRSANDYQQGGAYYWWKEDQEQITKTQAQSLKLALDRFFPKLDFTLVIVNYKEAKVEKISGIEGVIEFKIRKNQRTLDYISLFAHRLFKKER